MAALQQDSWDSVSSPVSSGSDNSWDSVSSPVTNKPSVAEDVGKTVASDIAPAAANVGAAFIPGVNAAMGVKAATDWGIQGGKALGETQPLVNAYAALTGQPSVSDADYQQYQAAKAEGKVPDTFSQDFLPARISNAIGYPSTWVHKAQEALGINHAPETSAGNIVGNTIEGASLMGKNAPAAILPMLAGSSAQEGVKNLGGNDLEQWGAGTLGGLAAAKAQGLAGKSDFGTQNSLAAKEGDALTGTPQSDISTVPQTSADIKAHYKEVRQATQDLGGAMSPDAAQDMLNFMKGSEPQNAVDRVSAKNNQLRNYALDLENEGFGKEPLTIDAYEKLHKDLGDAAWDERDALGNISPQGLQFQKAQQYLKALPDKATPDNGYIQDNNVDGFNAYKYGTKLYAQQAKLAQIEKIVHDSEVAPDPAAYQQQQFRNLFRSGKKSAGYTDDEMNTVMTAAKDGFTDKALDIVGNKLLIPAALLSSHVDAGAGLIAAKYGLGALANKLQTNKTNAVMDAVRNRDLGNQPDYVAMANAAKLNRTMNQPLRLPDYSQSIAVPNGGFYNAPREGLSLPRPNEMTGDDVVAAGRALPSPSSMPITLPDEAVKATYNPNDLNRGDEKGVPSSFSAKEVPTGPYNLPESSEPLPQNQTVAAPPESTANPQSVFGGNKQHLIKARQAALKSGISPNRIVVKIGFSSPNGQLEITNPSVDESAKMQSLINGEQQKSLNRTQAGVQSYQKRMANASGKDPTSFKNFLSYLTDNGGIKNEGGAQNIRSLGLGENVPVGLINSKGMTHNAALEKAIEDRWITDKGNNQNVPDQNDLNGFYKFMEKSGNHPHPEAAAKVATAQQLRDTLEDAADQHGVKYDKKTTNSELTDLLIDHVNRANIIAEKPETLDDEEEATRRPYISKELSNDTDSGKSQGHEGNVGQNVQGHERSTPQTKNAGMGKTSMGSNAKPIGKTQPDVTPIDDDWEMPFAKGGKVKK